MAGIGKNTIAGQHIISIGALDLRYVSLMPSLGEEDWNISRNYFETYFTVKQADLYAPGGVLWEQSFSSETADPILVKRLICILRCPAAAVAF